jgi:phospholipase/lecithinase/hemolysin
MIRPRSWRHWLPFHSSPRGCSVAAATTLTCRRQPAGAPPQGSFTAVVSFGDSLSDAGTYAPATSLSGGRQRRSSVAFT